MLSFYLCITILERSVKIIRVILPIVLLFISVLPTMGKEPQKVVVYRTKEDVSALVPVEMASDKSRIRKVFAPSEINDSTSPVPVSMGFFIDRQGLSPNAMFIDISRGQYSRLPQKPSKSRLNELLILPSYIETYVVLPFPRKAIEDMIPEVDSLIRLGFPGCKVYHGHGIEFGDPDFIIGTNY